MWFKILSNTSNIIKKKKIVTLIYHQSSALWNYNKEKSSLVFDTSSHFPSSLPITWLEINQLPRLFQKKRPIYSSLSRFVTCFIKSCADSAIGFYEDVEVIFLATY